MATTRRIPRHYPPHYDSYFQPQQRTNPLVTTIVALFYLIATVFLLGAFYTVLWPMVAGYAPSAAPVAPTVRPVVQPQAPAQSAPIEQAPAQSAPQAQPAPEVVKPAAAPLRFAATPEPPAWVPSAEQTAAYDAVRGTPVPVVYGTDANCNSANATYVTDSIKVEKDGVPIGAVQGWSCVSEADAVAEAQRRAIEMQADH